MWLRESVPGSSLHEITASGLILAAVALATVGAEGADWAETVAIGATHFVGDTKALDRLGSGGSARALAIGDFDEDGMPDLAVAVEAPAGGVLALYRGNADAIYPNTVRAKRKRAAGLLSSSPFASSVSVFSTPDTADLLAPGDFDADGHLDLLTASFGGDVLRVHHGDGLGALSLALEIPLHGRLVTLTSGDVNRRDGLADVAAVVQTLEGQRLLVFEDPSGAFSRPPETVDLGADVTDLALGDVDEWAGVDLAAAAGSELLIFHGTNHRLTEASAVQIRVSRLPLPFQIDAIEIGDFVRERAPRNEIAVLTGSGAVHVITCSAGENNPVGAIDDAGNGEDWIRLDAGTWRLSSALGRLEKGAFPDRETDMKNARVLGGSGDDLVFFGADDHRMYIMSRGEATRSAKSLRSQPRLKAPPLLKVGSEIHSGVREKLGGTDESARIGPKRSHCSIDVLDIDGPPRAVVPMRLNSDAISDLAVVVDGRKEPVLMITKASEIVVVDSTSDVADGVTTSIADLISNPGPDGAISLREAITAANNTSGADAVHFGISVDTDPGCDVGTGVCTIQPAGLGLPTVTDPLTIDGTTQPSFQSTPVIEIDGTIALADATGIAMNAGASVVRALVINRFAGNSDIVMWGAGGNIVEGNFLGVDASGTFNRGTTNSVHVYAISSNTIGGTVPEARNVISGNTNPAIALNAGASGNVVQGNFIGTDLTGSVALGNGGNDVVTLDSPDNTIGGTVAGAGNLVAGNLDPDFASVGLGFPASTGNLVQGNLIGTDATGTVDLGGASIGVYVVDGSNNTIGGTSPTAANVISGGDSAGVGIATGVGNIVQGNLIGTAVDGVSPLPNSSHGVLIYAGAADNVVGGRAQGEGNVVAHNGATGVSIRGDAGVGNTVVGNSLSGNTELGIDLCADFDPDALTCNDPTAVLPNDPNDSDAGANNLQNFPVLTAVRDGHTVDGVLDSIPNSDFTIDYYASSVCDPSGNGEGKTYLGSDEVTTNPSGEVTFTTNLATVIPAGWQLTATATDTDGSTSEMSECFEIEVDLIFVDGFESGDISAWSAGTE